MSDPPDAGPHPGNLPFRAWALQEGLAPPVYGAAPGGWDEESDAGERRAESGGGSTAQTDGGQAFLRQALAPDPEFESRGKTAVMLWVAAIFSTLFTAVGHFGLRQHDAPLIAIGATQASALVAAWVLYPRASPRFFVRFEEFMLLVAFAIIVFDVALSGWIDSPYLIWAAIPLAYSAHFQTPRFVLANCVIASELFIVALLVSYAKRTAIAADLIVCAMLLAVTWTEARAILRQRAIARRGEAALKLLALGDPLTGIANLRAFYDFAGELSRDDERFALVTIDLKGLRGTNAVFGYETGDEMLLRLAQLLLAASGPRDQVARIGGDEFAVLMPSADEAAVNGWIARLEQAMDEYNAAARGRTPQIAVSAGSALYPRDGVTADALRDAADKRLIAEKRATVAPVHELAPGTPVPRRGLGAPRASIAPTAAETEYEAGTQAATAWLLGAALLTLWLLLPGGGAPHPWSTVAIAAVCYCVGGFALLSRSTPRAVVARHVADVAVLVMIVPGLWATGGWQSPLQLAGVLVVGFYAQFYRGAAALWRIAATIGLYTVAFWTSGEVSAAGSSLYVAIVTVEVIVAAVLNVNTRATDRAQRAIERAAVRDPLTGLANVYAFRRDLDATIRVAKRNADRHLARPVLLIADIDDFHGVNLGSGHRGGDAVLAEVGRRLASAAGRQRAVYRVGGDEFAVLAQVDRLAEATQLADRCRRALNFTPSDGDAGVTCSVGYSIWHTDVTAEQLVQSVESALASTKGKRAASVPGDTRMLL